MGFKRTEHKNALLKLVREKRMILQREAEQRMNRTHINDTAKSLEQEGKIKRQKIKVRMKNGNLNDSWLLYSHTVKQSEILEYEKEMINLPFSSPLKEHHCYKKIDEEPTYKNVNNSDNIIDLSEYVKVNNQDMTIREYNGIRVVTSQDIARIHNKQLKHVNEIFKNNVRHLIESEDYFTITRENFKVGLGDLEKMFTSNRQKETYVFTESGYLLLVKTFTDDLSWTVQRELVNTYFKVKELKHDQSLQTIQQVSNLQSLDILELMVQEMKKQNNRIDSLEQKLDRIADALS